MNPMTQLTRRPVKAAFGALLLALAGVILALSRRGILTHPSQVLPPHGKRPGSWNSRNSRTGVSSVPGPGWAWSAGTAPA